MPKYSQVLSLYLKVLSIYSKVLPTYLKVLPKHPKVHLIFTKLVTNAILSKALPTYPSIHQTYSTTPNILYSTPNILPK